MNFHLLWLLIYSKEDQWKWLIGLPLIFFGRFDADAEAPILWPPDEKSCLIRKDADAGKDWRQEE